MDLRLFLLGPFAASWAAEPLAFASTASRALLAYLAVENDRPQPRKVLTALFWPDQDQNSAYTNLRQTVSRLRRALPAGATALQIRPDSLWLPPGAAEVDLLRFGELLAAVEAHRHADISSCSTCADTLEGALALYRGDFLQGIFLDYSPPFGEWLLFKREALHRRALDALALLSRIRERQGDFEALRRTAARLVELEPWNEQAHLALMRALLALGQRTAALAQYETCRRVLDEELGIAPGGAIRALYEQLRQEEPAPVAAANNLPAALTPFIGRERELRQLAALLGRADVRLLTLLGAGGMGKTRLAIEVAQAQQAAYADGACFVSLAALSDPDVIAPAIAAALGITLRGGDALGELLRALRGKELLLVLDNFEHLAGAATIVSDLLAAAPRLRCLVTSRVQLQLRGEHVLVVDGLPYAEGATLAEAGELDAVRLFVGSAARARGEFRLSERNLAAVLRICALVEGMPLGLELAAAWAEALSPAEIAAEIARSADFLSGEWADAPIRQRSLRAVFDWSWRLLAPDEQRLLRQLAVFSGGFSRDAAGAIAASTLPQLLRLRRKSLLRAAGADGTGERLGMHELLRQFAGEALQRQPEESAAVQQRHSDYYLQLVGARQKQLRSSNASAAAAEVGAEIDNIRQAWLWAVAHDRDGAIAASMWGLRDFYQLRGWLGEAVALFHTAAERLAARGGPTPPADRAAALLLGNLLVAEAGLLIPQAEYGPAQEALARAAELGRAWDDPALLARCALHWARIGINQGQFASAAERLDGALELARAAALPDVEAGLHQNLGIVAWSRGDVGGAAESMKRARAIYQASDDARGEVSVITGLGILATWRGASDEARGYLEAALALYRALGDRDGEAAAQSNLSDHLEYRGYFGAALAHKTQALAIYRAIGHRVNEALTRAGVGITHRLCGDYAVAREYLQSALTREEEIVDATALQMILRELARLTRDTGDYAASLSYGERALQLSQTVGNKDYEAAALRVMADARASLGQADAAVALYQQVLALEPALQPIHQHQAMHARSALAGLALRQGDLAAAQRMVGVVLDFLAAKEPASYQEPFALYLRCYEILQGAGDDRATTVLEQARVLLATYSQRIEDSALRQSFLENVAAQRMLRALVANLADDPSGPGAHPEVDSANSPG